MRFHIIEAESESIISNIDSECFDCYQNCNTTGNVSLNCNIEQNETKRYGKQITSKGTFFLCCSQTKTVKLFKEKLEVLKYSIPSLLQINKLAVKQSAKKNQENFARIVHNLRKINAQNIQQLYDLVPQSILTENIDIQLDIIQKCILEEPKKAAKMYLRIAQNCANIRSEFTVYDKLYIDNPNLSIREHRIQSIILNVYHPFEQEFFNLKVKVNISSFLKKIPLDYDTIRVALFHVFGNAIKYIKPNSIFEIDFKEEEGEVNVFFKMTSLFISKDELPKLFNDNYSGDNARKIHKEGTGIGMGIIKKALSLNNAILVILPGTKLLKESGIEYANNTFIIKFKLQQENTTSAILI